MAKTWVLDTDTKGTGARIVPLEDVVEKADRAERRSTDRRPPRRTPQPRLRSAPPSFASAGAKEPKRKTELAPGQVRKKATGEIGRVRSVDPKAGTAAVHWLKQGRISTVRLSAITRR